MAEAKADVDAAICPSVSSTASRHGTTGSLGSSGGGSDGTEEEDGAREDPVGGRPLLLLRDLTAIGEAAEALPLFAGGHISGSCASSSAARGLYAYRWRYASSSVLLPSSDPCVMSKT